MSHFIYVYSCNATNYIYLRHFYLYNVSFYINLIGCNINNECIKFKEEDEKKKKKKWTRPTTRKGQAKHTHTHTYNLMNKIRTISRESDAIKAIYKKKYRLFVRIKEMRIYFAIRPILSFILFGILGSCTTKMTEINSEITVSRSKHYIPAIYLPFSMFVSP